MADGGVDVAALASPSKQAQPQSHPRQGSRTLIEWGDNLQEQQDEVMALESIYGETGHLRVVSRPSEEGQELFSLEMDVEVPLPEDAVTVEVWVPYEHHKTPSEGPAMAKVPANTRPQFNRSESGRQWHSAFLVHHLRPLTLLITLPREYPLDGPPLFTLSGLWLDAGQLSALCAQLDLQWMGEGLGMPIIYTWVNWLKNCALSFLNLEKTVLLTPYLEGDEVTLGPRDPRALPECFDIAEDLVRLIEYDYRQEWATFLKGHHECGVCFCEYPGDQFYTMDECGHRCCHECITEYCMMHIADGTVQHLKCPEAECKLSVPPGVIRSVLGDTAYKRWERLCLQKALEMMDDVTWCPRCNAPVIRDQDETQAYCTECMYSFCPRCAEPFHMKSPCPTVEEQLAKIERETKKYAYDMNIPFDAVTGERKMTEEDKKRISVEKLRKLRAEFLTKAYLKKDTRVCPKCRAPIEKSGGCNKVTCSQCSTSMCWYCGKRINGYEHFREGSCILFPGTENMRQRPMYLENRPRAAGADAVQEAIQLQGRRAVNIMVCVRCGQRNLRNHTNNHIKCWSCKANLCFQCKNVITGNMGAHYTLATPCDQHGDRPQAEPPSSDQPTGGRHVSNRANAGVPNVDVTIEDQGHCTEPVDAEHVVNQVNGDHVNAVDQANPEPPNAEPPNGN